MESQEYLLKLQLLEQQANQFGEKFKIIDQEIGELINLKENMFKLETTREREIYAEISKGIFVKAQIDKKELLIDVGNKIFVSKSFKEIEGIINTQIKKFNDVKMEISKRINDINKDLDKLINGYNHEKGEKNNQSAQKIVRKKK